LAAATVDVGGAHGCAIGDGGGGRLLLLLGKSTYGDRDKPSEEDVGGKPNEGDGDDGKPNGDGDDRIPYGDCDDRNEAGPNAAP